MKIIPGVDEFEFQRQCQHLESVGEDPAVDIVGGESDNNNNNNNNNADNNNNNNNGNIQLQPPPQQDANANNAQQQPELGPRHHVTLLLSIFCSNAALSRITHALYANRTRLTSLLLVLHSSFALPETAAGVAEFADLIQHLANLEDLTICVKSTSIATHRVLWRGLASAPAIKTMVLLDLGERQGGVATMLQALQSSANRKTLQYLDLRRCWISDDDDHHDHQEEMNREGGEHNNSSSSAGGSLALARLLQRSPGTPITTSALKNVKLTACQISTGGKQRMAHAVADNRTLKAFLLKGIELGDECGPAFGRAIDQNNTLLMLEMDCCSQQFLECIARSMERRNTTLHEAKCEGKRQDSNNGSSTNNDTERQPQQQQEEQQIQNEGNNEVSRTATTNNADTNQSVTREIEERIEFYAKLNSVGRRYLFRFKDRHGRNHASNEAFVEAWWLQILMKHAEDIDVIYYLLSEFPTMMIKCIDTCRQPTSIIQQPATRKPKQPSRSAAGTKKSRRRAVPQIGNRLIPPETRSSKRRRKCFS